MKLDNSFIASDAEGLVYFPQYFNRMRHECYIEMYGDLSLIVNKIYSYRAQNLSCSELCLIPNSLVLELLNFPLNSLHCLNEAVRTIIDFDKLIIIQWSEILVSKPSFEFSPKENIKVNHIIDLKLRYMLKSQWNPYITNPFTTNSLVCRTTFSSPTKSNVTLNY